MPAKRDWRSQRALRLASGTALCLALSFGLALPIPFIAPLICLVLLANLPRPLPLKAGIGLAVLAALTTGSGLLLIPLLRYYPASGVTLIGLCLFLAFRYGLRGGNPLLVKFLVIGLTMISAAGTADFGLAVMVIEALVKGLLLAVLVVGGSHWLLPEPANSPAPPQPTPLPAEMASWVALRAWRRDEAHRQHLPPYVIFHDRTLAEIAARKPADMSALGAISGVGEGKRERYGEAVLDVLRGMDA